MMDQHFGKIIESKQTGNRRKATWVRKIMSFSHITIKYKGKFSWEPHGSLYSTTGIYFHSARVLNLGIWGVLEYMALSTSCDREKGLLTE